MGACASTPKTQGDTVEKVPAPEQPKEEATATATTEEVVVADKAVEDVKPEKEEPKEEVKTAVATNEEQEKSLGSLLESTEEVKKETVEEPKEVVAPAPAVDEKEEVVVAPAPVVEEKKEALTAEPKKE